MQLFIPLLQNDIFDGEHQATLRQYLTHHARSGLEPLHHMQRCFGTRFLSPCIIFCLVHLCDALFKHSPEEPPIEFTVDFCLRSLEQARSGFALCGPLQALFCLELKQEGLDLPHIVREYQENNGAITMDNILDACTRSEYTQPFEAILRFFDPALTREWDQEWQTQVINRGRQGGQFMQISNLLNT